ncbi:unnamed protein product [Rhizophagus irregularis]|uniref:Uncharacterized protein n=1 Tax=Rhizophagus irregularis TaxID=588596 RepID=A0A2I1GFX9_9GLOM|nr:hypothetical protein RhiirA4_517020 [Rhizophagus irregularis]CAB4440025.1 unnamed protein product [Rhizophagus irregularis]CAB4440147.1 unnamed protein product [Rhizophagus irregularis]
MNNTITTSIVVESPILTRRRKIFGTCKGCNQPNTNFNECDYCIKWLKEQESTLKSIIIQRKSLIYNQSCYNCNQPNHLHYKIAACNNCGFPEYNVQDLRSVAVEDIYDDEDYDHDDDDENEFTGIKISDLSCSKCDHPMTSWLKCPDYNEIIDMICFELNEMNFDDPDYQKLWEAKEYYEELLQQEQDDDQWVTEDEANQDYDDYDNEEEYEQYDEIIDPRTVLSILGLQKQYQNYFHPSSLQDQTKCLSLCLKIKV